MFPYLDPISKNLLASLREIATLVLTTDKGRRLDPFSTLLLKSYVFNKNNQINSRYALMTTSLQHSIAFFFLNFLLCSVSSMYTWSYIYPQESITLWKKFIIIRYYLLGICFHMEYLGSFQK
jgi:hypothetical protein